MVATTIATITVDKNSLHALKIRFWASKTIQLITIATMADTTNKHDHSNRLKGSLDIAIPNPSLHNLPHVLVKASATVGILESKTNTIQTKINVNINAVSLSIVIFC